MVSVCLMSQNFQIWINFFEMDDKKTKIANILNKILGASFASNAFGYEPRVMFSEWELYEGHICCVAVMWFIYEDLKLLREYLCYSFLVFMWFPLPQATQQITKNSVVKWYILKLSHVSLHTLCLDSGLMSIHCFSLLSRKLLWKHLLLKIYNE